LKRLDLERNEGDFGEIPRMVFSKPSIRCIKIMRNDSVT
jgi:hypothetical protein